jgi:phage tail sheath protein FI
MPAYTVPGVRFETVDADRATVDPARVDVTAFVGVTERGPLDAPVRLESWEQFTSTFGSFRPVGMLPYAVKGFFDNGGRTCHVIRVAAPELAIPLAAVAQPIHRRSSIVANPGELAPGSVVTIRDDELVHNYLAVGVDTATGVVTWDRQLDDDYVLASMELASGAGTANANLIDDGGGACVEVSAANPGTWGSRLSVVVSPSQGASFRTADAVQPPSREVSFVTSLAGIDPGAVVRISQGDPVLVTRRRVAFVDADGSAVGWGVALDPGYDLTKPLLFEVAAFNLVVKLDGATREVHARLSLQADHSRFLPVVLAAESALIRAEVLASLSDSTALPQPGPEVALRGGRDGTAGLRVAHLLGSDTPTERRGLATLELVAEPALVALPDLVAEPVAPVGHAPAPAPEVDPCCPVPVPPAAPPTAIDPDLVEAWPGFAEPEILAAQEHVVTFCEGSERVAVLDPPRLKTAGGALDLAALSDWRGQFDSSYAALYSPWVRVLDPLGGSGSDPLRAVPPSGHVAGVAGRVDAQRGPAEAPANQRLAWVQELDCDVSASEQSVLDPAGISCLRALPGRGLMVYGARTLSSEGNLRYLNVRRLLLAIRRTLRAELQWAAFEPADAVLREFVTMTVTGYLTALWQQGSLAGTTPDEAFLIRADDEVNPPEDAASGQFFVDVAVAVVLPAQYIIVRIGRTEDTLVLEEVS